MELIPSVFLFSKVEIRKIIWSHGFVFRKLWASCHCESFHIILLSSQNFKENEAVFCPMCEVHTVNSLFSFQIFFDIFDICEILKNPNLWSFWTVWKKTHYQTFRILWAFFNSYSLYVAIPFIAFIFQTKQCLLLLLSIKNWKKTCSA